MPEIKIIIGNKRYSSWSLRGWLAIDHTGLPYNEIKLRLDTPSFYEEIVKYSPAKRVPTLLDGDIAVWDSAAIIDYCARLVPEKFWWPADKAAYALARSVFNEMHSGFTEIRAHMPMNLVDNWQNLTLSDGIKTDVRRIVGIWTECREKHGAGGAFLFGEFSAVDMMFATITTRLTTYGIAVNSVSSDYINAVRNYPAMDKWFTEAVTETEIVSADQLDEGITHLG
ncbi:MAG: glutathione S-transferase family protein [Kordiimonadaceae bacterium]|nr:glutathione S-transferase family protein [Kordiimonadaceae bacterium]